MASQDCPDVAGRDLDPRPRVVVHPTAISLIQGMGLDLNSLLAEVYLTNDLRLLVKIVQALDDFGRDLRSVQAEIHHHTADAMGKEKKIDLGVEDGVVERYTTKSTKWDDDALVVEIAKHTPVAVDPSTGETTIDGVKMAALLKACASFGYWRKTKLRDLGVDPDEFSETLWGAKKVRVSKEDTNAVRRSGHSGGGPAKAQETCPDSR